jgi:hypothetical protein
MLYILEQVHFLHVLKKKDGEKRKGMGKCEKLFSTEVNACQGLNPFLVLGVTFG